MGRASGFSHLLYGLVYSAPPSGRRGDTGVRPLPPALSPGVLRSVSGGTPLVSSEGHGRRPPGDGRGIGPHDGLKKDSRCLSRVAAGNPGFP